MGHIYFGRNTNWMCPFCLTENHILLNTCKTKQISENKEEVMKKQKVPDLEKYIEGKGRRFVSYAQGAKLYKMKYWPFVRLAQQAESNYPIRKTAIVDLDILEWFLEEKPEVASQLKKKRRSCNV